MELKTFRMSGDMAAEVRRGCNPQLVYETLDGVQIAKPNTGYYIDLEAASTQTFLIKDAKSPEELKQLEHFFAFQASLRKTLEQDAANLLDSGITQVDLDMMIARDPGGYGSCGNP